MKFKAITEDFRQRIVKGEFPPRKAIPPRNELLKEYDISNAAFQRSINTLLQEGFLESRGIKGVCVVANPPHLSRYALCFPTDSMAQLHRDSLWQAMDISAAAITYESNGAVSFKSYFVGEKQNPSTTEWTQLFEDIAHHYLAGAIVLINEKFKPPRFPADFPHVIYDS